MRKTKQQLENEYEKIKQQLIKLRDNVTLKKWKLLSKAYKIGKQRYGRSFTKLQLSKDMNIPWSTTCRCLALDKATPENWEKVNDGQLSVFKLAMICQQKNNKFQNEIADIVISDNLSTNQIKRIKAGSLNDVNVWRHQKAVEKGYSREDSAYRSFSVWIDRGFRMLLMKRNVLTGKKRNDIDNKLRKLRDKITKYLGEENEK